MEKNNPLGTRDNNKVIAIVENEIKRFKTCQTRKKVVNHEEYIRGLIDMGLKLCSLTTATGKRLVQQMRAEKLLKMKQLDNM